MLGSSGRGALARGGQSSATTAAELSATGEGNEERASSRSPEAVAGIVIFYFTQ